MTGKRIITCLSAMTLLAVSTLLGGCQASVNTGVVEIELVQYKPEAARYFDEVEKKFNETHENIRLTISSPNDATTILKTRFIREDYPDIIGIGGNIDYSNFVDAGILSDVSDYPGLKEIRGTYLDTLEKLEYVPTEGIYGVPYAANAAGVLYNKEIFKEHGWKIPETWTEFIELCEEIQDAGLQPLYFGYKDIWTTLAPWNALAVDLAPADVCSRVNAGETTFAEEYREVAEKVKTLLDYGEPGPFAYNYNDACTAFARGDAVMYTIGSYAVPQILMTNPDIQIDSFVMPGSDDADRNVLNSGVDLQFCVMSECPNKEAAYEVLDFLLEEENLQDYIDAQNAVPCKEGNFKLASMLDGMSEYIEAGKTVDYQDHYYPAEMSVDAQIQTFLLDGDVDKFLAKFDKDWQRYNRDVIRKVQEYNAANGN
ncbi:MAG: extracellular solute-binding protein [Lachnospiraceae bacterium]|nr:extracellular solute-binding protein [Lachnospiraceae bacterium]